MDSPSATTYKLCDPKQASELSGFLLFHLKTGPMTPTPDDILRAAGTVPGTRGCPINAGCPSLHASKLKGPLHALPLCTGDKPSSNVSGTGAITCPVHSPLRGGPVWLSGM